MVYEVIFSYPEMKTHYQEIYVKVTDILSVTHAQKIATGVQHSSLRAISMFLHVYPTDNCNTIAMVITVPRLFFLDKARSLTC